MTDSSATTEAKLAATFGALMQPYGPPAGLAATRWAELAAAYTGRGRHYHTLTHLAAMLAELQPYRATVADWDALLLALFYHDAVYAVRRSDNEEASAALAAAQLGALGVPAAQVARVEAHIRATKTHAASLDPDTNLLLDADLAVLGQPAPAYAQYARQIRREYRCYPDFLYRPGRRQVLQRLLDRPHLYHTADFRTRYETAARQNLAQELNRE